MKNKKIYDLEGTSDINKNRKDKSYQDINSWPTFQDDFQQFKKYLLEDKTPKVLLRVYLQLGMFYCQPLIFC